MAAFRSLGAQLLTTLLDGDRIDVEALAGAARFHNSLAQWAQWCFVQGRLLVGPSG